MKGHAEGLIRPHQSTIFILFRLLDGLLMMLCLWASVALREIPWESHYSVAAASSVGIFYFVAEMSGLYRSRRGAPITQTALSVWSSWLITVFCLLLLAYATNTATQFSRMVIGTWFVLVPTMAVVWRLIMQGLLNVLRARGFNARSVAIVGAGEQGQRLAKTIIDTPALGMRLLAFFDDRDPRSERVISHSAVPIQGGLGDLVDLARRGGVDLVYITFSLRAEVRIRALLEKLSDTTVAVYIVPDFFVYNLLNSRWLNLGEIPTVSIFDTPFLGVDGLLKRVEDIVLGSLILSIASIPMLLVAIGVKWSSPGPIIFKQRRYGLDGREIEVWKFRTMSVCEDGDQVIQATRADPRITAFGAFLRRTSLDELPQFINVLQGRMSIVGPRPHAVAHNEQYRSLISGYMWRHKVVPGITGWAQIHGWRGETENLEKMQRRIDHDLWYIRSWSLWLDLKIILRTVVTGFASKRAY